MSITNNNTQKKIEKFNKTKEKIFRTNDVAVLHQGEVHKWTELISCLFIPVKLKGGRVIEYHFFIAGSHGTWEVNEDFFEDIIENQYDIESIGIVYNAALHPEKMELGAEIPGTIGYKYQTLITLFLEYNLNFLLDRVKIFPIKSILDGLQTNIDLLTYIDEEGSYVIDAYESTINKLVDQIKF